MADFKPLLLIFLTLVLVGALLNLTIAKHEDLTSPNPESALAGFSDFMENGKTITILGSELTFNPFGWLMSIGDDFLIKQINLMTYLPNVISIPLILLFTLSMLFVIITIIRGN